MDPPGRCCILIVNEASAGRRLPQRKRRNHGPAANPVLWSIRRALDFPKASPSALAPVLHRGFGVPLSDQAFERVRDSTNSSNRSGALGDLTDEKSLEV